MDDDQAFNLKINLYIIDRYAASRCVQACHGLPSPNVTSQRRLAKPYLQWLPNWAALPSLAALILVLVTRPVTQLPHNGSKRLD